MTTAGQQTSPHGGKRRLLVAVLLIVFGHATLSVAAANLSEMTGFGSNPGNLRMWTYIPDGLEPNAPLVVALHGCSQSAADYDDENGWVQYADRLGFALLLPEQKAGFWFGNHPLGCFNWYYRGDQQRDSGEVLSIIQMIDAEETLIDFMPNLLVPLLGVKSFLSHFILTVNYPEQWFSLRKP